MNVIVQNQPNIFTIECPVCMCDFDNKIVTHCGHEFCRKCLVDWTKVNNSCPICRVRVHTYNTKTCVICSTEPVSRKQFLYRICTETYLHFIVIFMFMNIIIFTFIIFVAAMITILA